MCRMNLIVADRDIELSPDIIESLRREGLSITFARHPSEIVPRIARRDRDAAIVLLDIASGDDGIAAISAIRRTMPGVPIIALSCVSSAELVINAVKAGATDFVAKPLAGEDLTCAVRNAVAAISRTPQPAGAARGEVFRSRNPRMQAIQSALKEIALSDAPVLMRGESGVGKEILATEIHAQSHRRARPFVKINCAALPAELIESELFGYERGAFTGAAKRKQGQFEAADGGTILLDEIGDMELRLQAKLLHVLQDHEFHRLGGNECVRVDVRVLAATHCDLEDAIRQRRFREDLYYRLNVITIRVPALRDRKEDILPLAEFLIARHSTPGMPAPPITPALKRALASHSWPGNIRELENVVRRLLVFGDPAVIVNELSRSGTKPDTAGASFAAASGCDNSPCPSRSDAPQERLSSPVVALDELRVADRDHEAAAIITALNQTGWHRRKAAVLLNVGYKQLLYRMKKLGIEHPAGHLGGVLAPPAGENPFGPGGAQTGAGRVAAVLPLENVRAAREQGEKDAIIDALNRSRWNRRLAAALLNVSYKGLLYRMRKLGISRSQPLKPPGRNRPGFDSRIAL